MELDTRGDALSEVGRTREVGPANIGPTRTCQRVVARNGMSSETVLFEMTVDGEHERYARDSRRCRGLPVFMEYNIELQANA